MVKQAESSTNVHSLNLYQKIAALVGELGPLAKKNKNEHFNYKYTGHDQVMEALAPLMAKYGIVIEPPEPLAWEAEERGTSKAGLVRRLTRVKFEYIIRNADKPEETIVKRIFAEAMDNEDKGFNKCSTQADKYLCFRLFRIATPADDPDALHSEKSDEKYAEDFDARTEGQRRIGQFQVNAFFEACAHSGKTAPQIADYLKVKFGIVQVEEMMRKDFNDAIKWAHRNGEMLDTLENSVKAAKARKPANGQAIVKALDQVNAEEIGAD